jgi:hypothetical protein
MSDVAAVVLTLGEQTTGRAVRSLEAQTLPPDDVVIVEGVRPFHRALNRGADRVASPFFVQLDADMVLDPDCIEVLRDGMGPQVGITVGALRDPLMGRIAGVKMFRRSCFDSLRLQDTVGPEIDFYLSLGRLGWQTRYLTGCGRRRLRSPALGDHRPHYGVDYVFGTYYLLGRLFAHCGRLAALRWRFTQLRRSAHAMAPVARLAMAHGIFGSETHDLSKPRPAATDSAFLGRTATGTEEASIPAGCIRGLTALAPAALFAEFFELGASLRAESHAGLRGLLRLLGELEGPRSLLAEAALGHGALARSRSGADRVVPAEFERLAEAWVPEVRLELAA